MAYAEVVSMLFMRRPCGLRNVHRVGRVALAMTDGQLVIEIHGNALCIDVDHDDAPFPAQRREYDGTRRRGTSREFQEGDLLQTREHHCGGDGVPFVIGGIAQSVRQTAKEGMLSDGKSPRTVALARFREQLRPAERLRDLLCGNRKIAPNL